LAIPIEFHTSHTQAQPTSALCALLLHPNIYAKNIVMKYVPKKNTDDALIQEFLNKGGKVTVGKTKPMKPELGISKNVWNNVLSKEEKAARDKK